MGIAYERGLLLYNQRRYLMAADEFRKEIAENPNYVLAMAMLALSLQYDGKTEEAFSEIRAAIAADSGVAFAHYALACIIVGKADSEPRLREAREHVMEAIRLNPQDANFFGLMSAIELDLRCPADCLDWAERGLAVRPDHIRCANLRARVLANLGRAREAREAIKGVLALDPEGASTHSCGGWTHLRLGEPEKALQHFNESVRLNPNDNGAHRGLHKARSAATRRKWSDVRIVILAAVFLLVGILGTIALPPNVVGPILVLVAIAMIVSVYRRRRRG